MQKHSSSTDTEGQYVTTFKRTDNVYMTASINKKADEKAKVIVKGEFMGPLSVNIFDRNAFVVFDAYIYQEKGFSKVYDLSKVKADELRMRYYKKV